MKKLCLVVGLLAVSILAVAGCAQPAGLSKLVITTDTVRGHIPSEWGLSCVLSSQWHRGEMIVWRTRVFDPETGNQVPDNPSDLLAAPPSNEELVAMAEGIKVTIHLSDGQSFPMHFGVHADADYFWTYGWEIPADYPTGTVDVWVTAEWSAESKTGRWDPFKVAPSLLTVLE